uniref:Uncharacterized protein n=1 Tax=Octopus bimaculoides TaxID=37653 RepID=A0A0L8HLL8_OCTBM
MTTEMLPQWMQHLTLSKILQQFFKKMSYQRHVFENKNSYLFTHKMANILIVFLLRSTPTSTNNNKKKKERKK